MERNRRKESKRRWKESIRTNSVPKVNTTIFSISAEGSLAQQHARIPAARSDQPDTWMRVPRPTLLTVLEYTATTGTAAKEATTVRKGYIQT